MRRRHLFKSWDSVQFPEIIRGNHVQVENTIKSDITEEETGGLEMRGTPACPGVVTGPAKVITHISDADTIEAGDILITHSTDIGWSPYFPILAAVVTELGGLISHGAVVAREYGLPCLVGVPGATRVFNTGDLVTVNAVKGILSKARDNDNQQ